MRMEAQEDTSGFPARQRLPCRGLIAQSGRALSSKAPLFDRLGEAAPPGLTPGRSFLFPGGL